MINYFCKKPLWECSVKLSLVATGKEKADLVIKNAKLVNVCTREIMEGADVAVSEGRIALVGDASHCVGEKTKIVDATGLYLAPAFLDGISTWNLRCLPSQSTQKPSSRTVRAAFLWTRTKFVTF